MRVSRRSYSPWRGGWQTWLIRVFSIGLLAGCTAVQPPELIPTPTPTETPTDTPTPTPTNTDTPTARPTATPPQRTPTEVATPTPTPTPEAEPCSALNPRILIAGTDQSGFVLTGNLDPGSTYECHVELRAQGYGDLEIALKPENLGIVGRGRTLTHTGTKTFQKMPGVTFKRYGAEKIPSGTLMSISISNTGSTPEAYDCWVHFYPR